MKRFDGQYFVKYARAKIDRLEDEELQELIHSAKSEFHRRESIMDAEGKKFCDFCNKWFPKKEFRLIYLGKSADNPIIEKYVCSKCANNRKNLFKNLNPNQDDYND